MFFLFNNKRPGEPEEYLNNVELRNALDSDYPEYDGEEFEDNITIIEGRRIIVEVEPRVVTLIKE